MIGRIGKSIGCREANAKKSGGRAALPNLRSVVLLMFAIFSTDIGICSHFYKAVREVGSAPAVCSVFTTILVLMVKLPFEFIHISETISHENCIERCYYYARGPCYGY